jgi:hypothetical protein
MPPRRRTVRLALRRAEQFTAAGLGPDVPRHLRVDDLIGERPHACRAGEQVGADTEGSSGTDPQNAGGVPSAPQPTATVHPAVAVVCLGHGRKAIGVRREAQAPKPGAQLVNPHAVIATPTSAPVG